MYRLRPERPTEEECRSGLLRTLWVTTAFFFCLLAASTAQNDRHSNRATAIAVRQPAMVNAVLRIKRPVPKVRAAQCTPPVSVCSCSKQTWTRATPRDTSPNPQLAKTLSFFQGAGRGSSSALCVGDCALRCATLEPARASQSSVRLFRHLDQASGSILRHGCGYKVADSSTEGVGFHQFAHRPQDDALLG